MKAFLTSYWGKFLLKVLVSIVISLAVFFGVYYGLGPNLRAASDASFVCFGILFGFAFFSLGNKYGFFTGLQYGFSFMFGSLGRYYRFHNGGTYGDFVESKKAKRTEDPFPFLPYLFFAVLWLIAAIVLVSIYNSELGPAITPPSV